MDTISTLEAPGRDTERKQIARYITHHLGTYKNAHKHIAKTMAFNPASGELTVEFNDPWHTSVEKVSAPLHIYRQTNPNDHKLAKFLREVDPILRAARRLVLLREAGRTTMYPLSHQFGVTKTDTHEKELICYDPLQKQIIPFEAFRRNPDHFIVSFKTIRDAARGMGLPAFHGVGLRRSRLGKASCLTLCQHNLEPQLLNQRPRGPKIDMHNPDEVRFYCLCRVGDVTLIASEALFHALCDPTTTCQDLELFSEEKLFGEMLETHNDPEYPWPALTVTVDHRCVRLRAVELCNRAQCLRRT